MARRCEKWGFLLWIFAKGREIGGVYWSVIGHRLRVGAMGMKGKVQEWCRWVWMGVEMWEMRDPKRRTGSNVHCIRKIGTGWILATSETYGDWRWNLIVGSV